MELSNLARGVGAVDLRLLTSLVAVGDCGSYTRAAEDLSLTQPSVYRQVRTLERQLGTPLVEVDGKRVRLTEAGRVAYQFGRRLLSLADGLQSSIESSKSGLAGTLALGATPSVGEFPLADCVLRYHVSHPELRFRMRLAFLHNAEIDHLVGDGSLDLAMHSNPTPRPGLVKEILFSEGLVVLAPKGHRFAALDMITQQDLSDETLVYADALDSAVVRAQEDEWLASAGVEPHWWASSNSHIGLRSLVRCGGGIAIMAAHSARQIDGHLFSRPIVDSPIRHVFVVRRAALDQTPLADGFIRFLKQFDWPGWQDNHATGE